MHTTIRTLALSAVLLTASLASANYKQYPYDCPAMDAKQGVRHIYPFSGSCSLRQHPDKIEQCKKGVLAREAPHYEKIEKSLDTACKNRNGYLRTTTCLSNHTFVNGDPANASWVFQSATGYYCYYN